MRPYVAPEATVRDIRSRKLRALLRAVWRPVAHHPQIALLIFLLHTGLGESTAVGPRIVARVASAFVDTMYKA